MFPSSLLGMELYHEEKECLNVNNIERFALHTCQVSLCSLLTLALLVPLQLSRTLVHWRLFSLPVDFQLKISLDSLFITASMLCLASHTDLSSNSCGDAERHSDAI